MTLDNGSCPFHPKLCRSSTVVFDTGLIDSHTDLGINSRVADRIAYRRVTTCTVLNDTSYTTGWISQANGSTTQTPWRVAYAYFGPDETYPEMSPIRTLILLPSTPTTMHSTVFLIAWATILVMAQ
jgi:hypothetical protein